MREWIGASVATLFGLALLVVGGRLVVYEHLLTREGRTVPAEITEAGSVRHSSGGYVDYVRYRFADPGGQVHHGQASGYSGATGETILVQYASRFPAVHRVSGEGRNTGYRWRWAFVGIGAVFLVAGGRWLLNLRAGRT